MASDKQILANQLNAKKSTGPQTKAGKQQVSKNALKHGLAAVVADEEINAIAEGVLADLYAGKNRSVIVCERAREIAESQSLIIRARATKAELLKNASDEPSLGDLLDQYRRIDRYKQRAVSRRKTLLRDIN